MESWFSQLRQTGYEYPILESLPMATINSPFSPVTVPLTQQDILLGMRRAIASLCTISETSNVRGLQVA
jgi:hypothetical protein